MSQVRFTNLDELRKALKAHVDIQQLVISDLGEPATSSGDNNFHWCPFHGEKNKPSLAVSSKMHFYKCFGCRAGGDAINWMRERHNVSLVEAIDSLAQKYNFDLRPFIRPATPQEVLQDRYYHIYRVATEFCHTTLVNNPQYLSLYIHDTGFTTEQIATYKVGYSASSNGLVNFLYTSIQGLSNDDVNKLELTNSSMWDGAFVYPIHNASGQVSSFRNKPVAGVAAGKYLGTSKNNPLFEEGLVYGLYQTKQLIKQNEGKIVVVEGQKAAISTRSVAVMGTNISEKQLETLRDYGVTQITAVFDGDQAGYAASLRLLDEARNFTGILLKIGQLPLAAQPDTLIGQEGLSAWHAVVDSAQLPIEFYISNKLAYGGQLTIQQKYQIITELAGFLRQLSGLEADVTSTFLAERLQVDAEHVRVHIQSLRAQESQLSNVKAEAAVLHHIVLTPPNISLAKQQMIEPDTFTMPQHQWIYQAIVSCHNKYHGNFNPQTVRDEIGLIAPKFIAESVSALDGLVLESPTYEYQVAVQKVVDLWRRRQAIVESNKLSAGMRDLTVATDQSVTAFRRKLITAVSVHDQQANTPQQLAEKARTEMYARAARPGGVVGMDFSDGGRMYGLNAVLSGLQPGHMTVIAANQGAGKSLMALNMIKPIAIDQRIPWLWIPQEMTDNETIFRLNSIISGVDNNHIQKGRLTNEERDKVEWGFNQIYQGKLFCYKPQGGSIDEVLAAIDDYKFRHGIMGVTWDYLQLVGSSKEQRGMSREEILGDASRIMKNEVAEKMKICALVIAQLNRSDYKEGQIRSGEHMGGSYRISQDCDDLMTVYKKTLDQIAEDGKERGNGKVYVNKRRGGVADLMFHCDFDRYNEFNLRFRECLTQEELVGVGRVA
jgi:DNA primase catalytic core